MPHILKNRTLHVFGSLAIISAISILFISRPPSPPQKQNNIEFQFTVGDPGNPVFSFAIVK